MLCHTGDIHMKNGILLTPKNLYRVLTTTDYPIYSKVPITKAAGNGLTLGRFWREQLGSIIPVDLLDKLFDCDSKRSRAQSYLMNRSSFANSLPRYISAYLNDHLSPDMLVQLTTNIGSWLMRMHCDYNILDRRIQAMLTFCAQGDIAFTNDIADFFTGLRSKKADHPIVQLCALQLAWLTLHALYGNEMQEALSNIRKNKDYSTSALLSNIVI